MPIYDNKKVNDALIDICDLNSDLPENSESNAVGIIFLEKYLKNISNLNDTLGKYFHIDMEDFEGHRDDNLEKNLSESKVLAAYYESGTCFLVSNQYILTAKHVIENQNIEDLRVIFKACYKKSGRGIEKSDTFKIEGIVAQGTEMNDWALLKLSDPVVGVRPLSIDYDSSINANAEIYMLGFPLSWPQKCSYGVVIENDDGDRTISTQIDGFANNSGSPVFNKESNKIIGIFVSSQEDFNFADPHVVKLETNGTDNDLVQRIPEEVRLKLMKTSKH